MVPFHLQVLKPARKVWKVKLAPSASYLQKLLDRKEGASATSTLPLAKRPSLRVLQEGNKKHSSPENL